MRIEEVINHCPGACEVCKLRDFTSDWDWDDQVKHSK